MLLDGAIRVRDGELRGGTRTAVGRRQDSQVCALAGEGNGLTVQYDGVVFVCSNVRPCVVDLGGQAGIHGDGGTGRDATGRDRGRLQLLNAEGRVAAVKVAQLVAKRSVGSRDRDIVERTSE